MKMAPIHIPDDLQIVADPKATALLDRTISEVRFESSELANVVIRSLTIEESVLSKVNLANATLERFDLLNVRLATCELTTADCDQATWKSVAVSGSRATGISLTNGMFENVIFENCKLDLANFRYSKFKNVLFKDCQLTGADFYHTILRNVTFDACTLKDVEISQATFSRVDVRTSDILELKGIQNLKGVTISTVQLMQIAPILAHNLQIQVED